MSNLPLPNSVFPSQFDALDSAISIAKFLYHLESAEPSYRDIPVITTLQERRNSIQQRHAQFQKDIALNPKHIDKLVPWPIFLAAIEKLRQECALQGFSSHQYRTPDGIAWSFQRFLMLGFFGYVCPFRQQVYRNLEWGKSLVKGFFDTQSSNLEIREDGNWFIVLKARDYKTGYIYGCQVYPVFNKLFPDGSTFYEYLEEWRTKWRPYLVGEVLKIDEEILSLIHQKYQEYSELAEEKSGLQRLADYLNSINYQTPHISNWNHRLIKKALHHELEHELEPEALTFIRRIYYTKMCATPARKVADWLNEQGYKFKQKIHWTPTKVGRLLMGKDSDEIEPQVIEYITQQRHRDGVSRTVAEYMNQQEIPKLVPWTASYVVRLLNPSNDYVFVGKKGRQFTKTDLYSLVQNNMYRLTGKWTNPHLLRHIYITYCLEAERPDEYMDALQLLMQHSKAMQRGPYNLSAKMHSIMPALQMIHNEEPAPLSELEKFREGNQVQIEQPPDSM